MFRKTVINLILILFLILSGYALGAYFGFPGYNPHIDTEIESDSLIIKDDKVKIDSLVSVIEEYKEINDRLRDSIQVVITTRIIEVDAVKKLPLDSGVIFLKHKLREYENR